MAKSNLAKFDASSVSAYVESDDKFPVPFDGLWQAVGYSRKDNALRQLRSELIEGVDFISSEVRNRSSGKASSVFRLTADGAKVFAVRARTPEGVELAKLFVAAYNELKAKYQELKKQQQSIAVWQQARLRGKKARRQLTDAVQDYIDRHRSELSENAIRWMYINVSERVNLIVFGRKAKRLAEDLQISRDCLRNGMDESELRLVESVEDTAVRLIDQMDMHPDEAVKLAGVNLLIPVQTRGLIESA